ncbi:MAG: HsdR family type I site-specific deoxyribonuclease [Hydrogenophaga sp.]|jgi:type I restriction enzyme R subunit|nr:HsdR family type I site-specific deoxyribonuclease [Thiobacillus sp.]MDP3165871.1 HsdR family type I site-specific deoxyribonuclease [Hydrogenophaga sp.]
MESGFSFNEKHLSQIPALHLLANLGYRYLTPEQALVMRGGRLSNVLLEEVLRDSLKRINRIQHKGENYLFSEENIQSAIQRLKNVKYDGLLKTNEAVYDLLTLGVALEQSVEGAARSFTLNYIDWKNPENNVYHVTAEFPVERTRSHETARPDIVLFVNGIPFAVIECKSPNTEVAQAVSQMIRNQRDEYIPTLFTYTQLVIATNKNHCKYATVGTAAKYWAVWREEQEEKDEDGAALRAVLDQALPQEAKAGLYELLAEGFGVREPDAEYLVRRALTEQDRTIYALCRPERLLRMALQFTVFDGGRRKIARYQQFFAVERILGRVKQRDDAGRRAGGIVWHTQGSGKSLTMVMLAKALVLDLDIRTPRIVLVTDRVDLDKQLGNTFAACGLTPDRAESGRHLVELVAENKAHIVTSLIHKFDKALSTRKFQDESTEIFVLVDETQRTQLGMFSARMRQMFPNACYIGFTGTPLLKREKSDVMRFGGIIHTYAINQAVSDGAIVPLLYEGRLVEIEQNKAAIDVWFERHTEGLTSAQKADLKKKYARAEMLNKADQVIYMRAFDISAHFQQNWQGTGFKAQLVAPSKVAALKYKAFLDDIGEVSSEVIISAPDEREGFDDVDDDESTDEVVAFWQRMMKRYGDAEAYETQIINTFKHGSDPEILIVVSKLLTGFDAPRNTVLYLTRKLKEHTLLQAIARVNRLYDDDEGAKPKEFGYIIDYAGILGELDQALTTYSALEGFEECDLAGALSSINDEVRQLPQRHAELWDVFKTVVNRQDEEAFEKLLSDEKIRENFYERLSAYAKTLAIAMSSEEFITTTPENRFKAYKTDLKRFTNLKAAVKLRYAESIDYRDYEPKIQKLLDTHISANEVLRLNEPVNIFDSAAFQQVVEEQGHGKPTAAKADMIAHATKRAITEHLDEDPAFFEKFSKLIQQAIDDYRAGRISDLEYLKRASEIKDAVVNRKMEDVPAVLRGNDHAIACFGVLEPYFGRHVADATQAKAVAAEAAVSIWAIVERNRVVGFWDNLDAQRRAMNEMDDFLYDKIRNERGIPLTTEEMDEIINRSMQLARHRMKT